MKRLFLTATCILFLGALTILPAPRAMALTCVPSLELGKWENISSGEQDIIWLVITSISSGCEARPIVKPFYGPTWYIEVFGGCGAEKCNWGRIGGTYLESGRYGTVESYMGPVRVTPVFTAFDLGRFSKYLYIYASPFERGQLHVRVYTDYPDDGRQDTVEILRFSREPNQEGILGAPITLWPVR